MVQQNSENCFIFGARSGLTLAKSPHLHNHQRKITNLFHSQSWKLFSRLWTVDRSWNTFEAISDRALRCVWCKGKTILTDPTWTTYLYSHHPSTPGCCPRSRLSSLSSFASDYRINQRIFLESSGFFMGILSELNALPQKESWLCVSYSVSELLSFFQWFHRIVDSFFPQISRVRRVA